MQRILLSFIFLLLVFGIGGKVNAATIDFSEIPLGTTDPTISGVSFWAGSPTFNSTITLDQLTPGDPYLVNGYDDGTGNSPGLYDTFIGANLITPGKLFKSVSIDILSEAFQPPDTTLFFKGFLGGIQVGSMGLVVGDNNYYNLSFIFATGADTLHIYDDIEANGFANPFHIDNFAFTETTTGVPEPSTMLLLGSGLLGLWGARKKFKK